MKKLLLLTLFILSFANQGFAKTKELLNASYDPTREFYEEYNEIFAKHWKEKTGEDVKITQSHGGSGKQARSVIDGLDADVVTLALSFDIDNIASKSKLLTNGWQEKFPNNSSPYTSTIVFLVKKGNPKAIKDWDDLTKEGVSVITPNPKTSGGARWNYLAAYGFALNKYNKDEAKALDFLKSLFANVPLLDTGARGSTTTFAKRNIGDVLITWENEAYLTKKELGQDKFEIIYPSLSILAEPPVAVVEKTANKKGNLEVANEYLNFLYTKDVQRLIAKHFYRPTNKDVLKEVSSKYPTIKLLTIEDFGGWKQAQKKHFDDGGSFDKIYLKK
ncbi:MAG: sulfate ABC transporter substrate-binding protein [Alphaproteobacteria bacterium]|jgi:sulfate/thiosulfate-binding protein